MRKIDRGLDSPLGTEMVGYRLQGKVYRGQNLAVYRINYDKCWRGVEFTDVVKHLLNGCLPWSCGRSNERGGGIHIYTVACPLTVLTNHQKLLLDDEHNVASCCCTENVLLHAATAVTFRKPSFNICRYRLSSGGLFVGLCHARYVLPLPLSGVYADHAFGA